MKASQKFIVKVENLTFVQRFDELDRALLPLVAKLERVGDLYGPVSEVIFKPCGLCVSITYADKKRDAVKPTIFGFDSDELLARQR